MYIGHVRVVVFAHCKIAAFLDSGRFFRIAIVRCANMPETAVCLDEPYTAVRVAVA
jgi:hypothetical protein